MKWVKHDKSVNVPVKSWCAEVDELAMEQAANLANHPAVFKHVALMPDCHVGYGMPIGGVIGCQNTVIPNAVGVDIGCGMGAVETSLHADVIKGDMKRIRAILDDLKKLIPVGEGNAHKKAQDWKGFGRYLDSLGIHDLENTTGAPRPGWLDDTAWNLAARNLGTLGGGNHFIELQESDSGMLWMMLHSGSRNLGYRIASHYHKLAVELNSLWHSRIPSQDLAFLPAHSSEGLDYIRDMNFALEYAAENRKRMMDRFKETVTRHLDGIEFLQEINIHHNYAALENHFGKNLWVHRKGATSAKNGQMGIIPGSMGTPSYIVMGLGNPDSFESCSHGAGRVMGRLEASRNLTVDDCNKAMEGVVFDRWKTVKSRKKKSENGQRLMDLGEAPQAYKDIDSVIEAELDLIKPMVKLSPLGVVKG